MENFVRLDASAVTTGWKWWAITCLLCYLPLNVGPASTKVLAYERLSLLFQEEINEATRKSIEVSFFSFLSALVEDISWNFTAIWAEILSSLAEVPPGRFLELTSMRLLNANHTQLQPKLSKTYKSYLTNRLLGNLATVAWFYTPSTVSSRLR